jgi:SET domain
MMISYVIVLICFVSIPFVTAESTSGFVMTKPTRTTATTRNSFFVPWKSKSTTSTHYHTELSMNSKQIIETFDTSFSSMVEILPSQIVGGGKGLFLAGQQSKNGAHRGDILLEIPKSNVLSVDCTWEDDPILADAFWYLSQEGGVAGRMAALAGYVALLLLLFQQPNYDTRTTKMTFQDTPYFQYSNLLSQFPKDRNDLDHVLWWSDEEVERLLQKSNVYEQVLKLREDTQFSMDMVWQVLNTEKQHHQPLLSLSSSSSLLNLLPSKKDEWDVAIQMAYVSLYSRGFQDDEWDCMKLIPWLDMIQHTCHDDQINVEHVTMSSGDIQLLACCDIHPGEELMFQYHPTLKPYEYFPIYGFVPEQQSSCQSLLEHKSHFFFPTSQL